MDSLAGFPSTPGPADRESFFAAQARHRRAAWRLTAAYALSAVAIGVALAPVVTPLLAGFLVLAADVVNLLVPAPDLLPLPSWLAAVEAGGGGWPAWPAVAAGVALLLLPGALVVLFAWLAMRALFLDAGVDAVAGALGARAPRADDFEERQLENLVEEMGIAAGLPPPRLALLDVDAANAAVVAGGSSAANAATLLVTRGLLARLDREATQGVVAHLVAAAGNGDPRSACNLLALLRTYGLATAFLSSPYGPEGRRTVARLLRWSVRRRGPRTTAEAQEVDALLARALTTGSGNDDAALDRGRFPALKTFFLLPFFVAQTAFWVNQQILSAFLLGPLLTGLWRTRRYMADADAVQLTRNPDGLARALAELAALGDGTAVAGAESAAHLFLVWPIGKRDLGSSHGFPVSFHPPTPGRLRRLAKLGAAATWQAPAAPGLPPWLSRPLVRGALLPLGLCLLALFLGGASVMVLASLGLDLLYFFGLFVGPLHYLLRYVLGG